MAEIFRRNMKLIDIFDMVKSLSGLDCFDKLDSRYDCIKLKALDEYHLSEMHNYFRHHRKVNYKRLRKVFMAESDKHKNELDFDKLKWQ